MTPAAAGPAGTATEEAGMGQGERIDEWQVHQAIVGGEMFLEYMPLVSLAHGGRCVGGEALVRWRRGGTVVMPMDFIPAIENTPVAGTLTYWVIDTVAEQLGDWLRRAPDVHVGINVPPEVLGRGGLDYASRKSRLLDVGGRILLEVTERGIPDRLGLEELEEMSREGMQIALDDVGTDGGNLLVLFQAPVDAIKLDGHVAHSIGPDGDSPLLRRIAPLIRASGRTVVAEYVERPEQEAAFREAGVQLAQGWLYSRPLPAAQFIAWHAARS